MGVIRAIFNFFALLVGSKKLDITKAAAIEDVKGREILHPNDMRRVKLALIVGHTAKNPGAKIKTTGQHEYEYNTKLAYAVKDIAPPQIEVVVIFRDGIGIAGAYSLANEKEKADFCIELHFNDFDGTASGSEVLCTQDSNDCDFAHYVLKHICKAFNRIGESRGVKVISRNDRGSENVHAFGGGANCLVEPFFGDNSIDAELAYAKFDDYAKGLLAAVNEYATKNDMI